MSLPAVTVPPFLPFDFPLLAHPVIVHFAIVLPILVLLIELLNFLFKQRSLSVTSLLLLALGAVVYAAAYFSGSTDGKEAYELLTPEGQALLKNHKLLGGYLVYAMLLPLAMKLIAMTIGRTWGKGLLIVSLALVIGFIIKQGRDGGELVYGYGANVTEVSRLQEASEDQVDALADMNETLRETAEELRACQEDTIGNKVETGVQKAVESVKALFADTNATEGETEENVSEAQPAGEADDDVIAIDGNESNETF